MWSEAEFEEQTNQFFNAHLPHERVINKYIQQRNMRENHKKRETGKNKRLFVVAAFVCFCVANLICKYIKSHEWAQCNIMHIDECFNSIVCFVECGYLAQMPGMQGWNIYVRAKYEQLISLTVVYLVVSAFFALLYGVFKCVRFAF